MDFLAQLKTVIKLNIQKPIITGLILIMYIENAYCGVSFKTKHSKLVIKKNVF